MATKTPDVKTEDEGPAFKKPDRLAWIREHLWIHRPFYLWLPIVLLGIWGLLHGYHALTGRAPVDDMPIGALGNLLVLIVAIILTNWTKPRLFDDIDTTKEDRWWRVAIDSIETVFLLWLFWYALSH